MKFSANLGFLWKGLPLTGAVRAAKAAGFDAVEFHWPYDVPAAELRQVLGETGLPVLGVNTVRGDLQRGENGLAALPGREAEARAAIDQAIAYAAQIGARNVHVMSGVAEGPAAHETVLGNLRYACDRASEEGIGILIEPLNGYDAPGYFLSSTGQARAIIEELGSPALRMMFDFYHVQVIEGDVSRRLETLLPFIGHIQIAAAPGRGEPDGGELCYRHVLGLLDRLGWPHPIGCEYKVADDCHATLDWVDRLR